MTLGVTHTLWTTTTAGINDAPPLPAPPSPVGEQGLWGIAATIAFAAGTGWELTTCTAIRDQRVLFVWRASVVETA